VAIAYPRLRFHRPWLAVRNASSAVLGSMQWFEMMEKRQQSQ
jgi:hypothetical protein